MKIITAKQRVLDLILNYWDNPSPTLLETTLSNIHEIGATLIFISWPSWDFDLTKDSLKNLAIKYLHQEVSFKIEEENLQNEFLLTGPLGSINVNSKTLLMKIRMREDLINELLNYSFNSDYTK